MRARSTACSMQSSQSFLLNVSPALREAVELVLALTACGGDVAVQFGLGDQLGHQPVDAYRNLAAGADVPDKK